MGPAAAAMKVNMDGSRYLTLDDVRNQWRVTNRAYDHLRSQEAVGTLSPRDAHRLAAWEKRVVESYTRVVKRWADRTEKEGRA
jgi:hypothetical protein